MAGIPQFIAKILCFLCLLPEIQSAVHHIWGGYTCHWCGCNACKRLVWHHWLKII